MGLDANWHILASTMIRALAYDSQTRELRVRFSNGGVYRYFEVPPEIVEALIDPPEGSHGAYFNEHIRDGYEFEEESVKH